MKNVPFLLFLLICTRTMAQSPLDLTFGSSGIASFPDFYSNHCVSASVQSDGKILCYYTSSVSCFGHFIFRLMPNGSMDTSFHTPASYQTTPNIVPGVFYMSGSGLPEIGQTFIRQTSQGDIIIGMSGSTILKRKNNGDIDASFGNMSALPGYSTLNASSATTFANPLFDFYEDVAAGAYYYASRNPNRDSVIIAKTLPNGQMDNTYGTMGIKVLPLPASFYSLSCDIYNEHFTKDGHLMLCGNVYTSGADNDAFVARYNLNGTLDNTFGSGGVCLKNNAANDEFYSMTEYPNGDIYATGRSSSPDELFTVKVKNNGQLDNTFGTSGKKTYPFPPASWGNPYTVSIPYAYNSPLYTVIDCWLTPFNRSQAYYSLTNTGADNLLFATAGTWNPGVNYRIDQMVSQADGKILSFGSDSSHARILRYNSTKTDGIIDNVSSAATLYQLDHDVVIEFSSLPSSVAYSLYSINGNLINRITTNQINKIGNKDIIHLPDGLSKGLYLFVAEFSDNRYSLKVRL